MEMTLSTKKRKASPLEFTYPGSGSPESSDVYYAISAEPQTFRHLMSSLSLTAMLFSLPTSAFINDRVKTQFSTGHVPVILSDSNDVAGEQAAIISVPAMVWTIRDAFELNMSELAAVLGVQRPTVYGWIEGDQTPHERNRQQLTAIYEIADAWIKRSTFRIKPYLRQHIAGGESLYTLLSNKDLDVARVHTALDAIVKYAHEMGLGQSTSENNTESSTADRRYAANQIGSQIIREDD